MKLINIGLTGAVVCVIDLVGQPNRIQHVSKLEQIAGIMM
jgi:hypothetical protein